MDSLQQLCRQLVALRLVVDLSVGTLCGEPDVRLRICRREVPDASVELLVPDPATWSARNWDAVLVQQGQRRLWRGPDQDCPLDEAATFVRALLSINDTGLAERYAVLG